MSIKTHVDINTRIIRIWDLAQQQSQDTPFLSPCFFSSDIDAKKPRLLFIGLNPSYSESGWKKMLKLFVKKNPNSNLYSSDLQKLIDSMGIITFKSKLDWYFSYSNLQNKQAEIVSLDNTSLGEHDYFKKMRELAEHLYGEETKDWYHIDLYYYRKTTQKELKKLVYRNGAFFKEQLSLSKDIISWLNPEMIVVANAFAGEEFRNIFKDQFNFQSDFFKEIPLNIETGAYELKLNGRIIHVIFSGMFSGQHAMDIGSFERLKWHLKAVKEGKKMNPK